MRATLRVLSDEEIEVIHDSGLRVLENVGVLVRNSKALRLLQDAGAEVDYGKQLVKAPASLVKECLRRHPSSFTLYGREKKNDVRMGDDTTLTRSVAGCTSVLDDSGARAATVRDVQELTRLSDALGNMHQATMIVYARDVPNQISDVYTAAHMLRNTTKNCYFATYNVHNLEYIVKLAASVAGGMEELRKKPAITIGIAPISPLELSEDIADQLMFTANCGVPVMVDLTPMAGGTAPVTHAGALVQQMAEFMISHVIVQLVNPGNAIYWAARSVPLDMRTAIPALGSIEYGLMAVAAIQLARYSKVPSDVCTIHTDSKILDEQSGFERAMNSLMSALAGANLISGAGVLESSMTASQVQLVIDNELCQMITRAARGIEVTPETLAMDLIREVGAGGNYLTQEHTRKHYLIENYLPTLSDRRARQDWEKAGSKDIVVKAREVRDKILREHEVEALDDSVIMEMDGILVKASTHI